MTNRFSSIFKEESVAGLDIGQDYIAAAYLLIGKDDTIKIENIGWAKIEPDTPDSAIASAIKQLWRKCNITTRAISISFHSPSLVLKHFKYSNLSDQELSSTLWLDAEHTFQRSEKELVADWIVYNREPTVKEGILISAPRKELERYLKISRMSCLYPIAAEISATAISNLFLKARSSFTQDALCIINAGRHNADLVILTKDKRIYPRILSSPDTPWQENIGELSENINDIFRYAQFKLHYPPVSKIILTGSAASDKKFRQDLKTALDLPLEFWNPLNDIASKRYISAKDVETCGPVIATALGLAMRKG